MSGDLHVFWYNPDDNTVTDMNAIQVDGYLTFYTTHFSYYAIAQFTVNSDSSNYPPSMTPNPKSGDNSFGYFYWWLMVALSVIVVTHLCSKRNVE